MKKEKPKLRYTKEQMIEAITTAYFYALNLATGGRIADEWIEKFKAEDYLIDAK